MGNDTRATQILHILQNLASLPGGRTVDVSFKKLPRFGPAEPGTSYQASRQRYPVADLPDRVAIPEDTEEVVIQLQGALGATMHRHLLVEEMEELFEEPVLHDNWDVRVHFQQNQDRPPLYELTVFSHSPVSGAEAV